MGLTPWKRTGGLHSVNGYVLLHVLCYSCALPPERLCHRFDGAHRAENHKEPIIPSFNTEVAHSLGQTRAKERIMDLINQIRQQYQDQVTDFSSDWIENTLKFTLTTYGFDISGTVQVEESRALVAGNLPFLAVPFRQKIEQSIAGELARKLV